MADFIDARADRRLDILAALRAGISLPFTPGRNHRRPHAAFKAAIILIKFVSPKHCFVLRSERLIPKSVPSNAITISPPDPDVTDIAAQFTANYGECCS